MKRFIITALLVPLNILVWAGCSKKGPTTVMVAPASFALAEISLWKGTGFSESVSVFSDSVLDLSRCSAQISFGTTQHGLVQKDFFPWGVRFTDTLHLPLPGMPCSMAVTTNAGYCQGGHVNMPGPYQIFQASPYDTMPWDSARVYWSSSRYATWYDLWVHCDLYDGARNLITSADTMMISTGTYYLIPGTFLHRDANAVYAEVSVLLEAHDGAMPGFVGDGGMSGTFRGYFYSTNASENDQIFFYVGTPHGASNKKVLSPGSEEKRRQALFRAFGVPMKSY